MTNREMYLVAGICSFFAFLALFLNAVSSGNSNSIIGAAVMTFTTIIWFGLYTGVLGEEDSEEDTEDVCEE